MDVSATKGSKAWWPPFASHPSSGKGWSVTLIESTPAASAATASSLSWPSPTQDSKCLMAPLGTPTSNFICRAPRGGSLGTGGAVSHRRVVAGEGRPAAPVHDHVLAGDEAGEVRHQEHQRTRDLEGHAHAAQRHLLLRGHRLLGAAARGL